MTPEAQRIAIAEACGCSQVQWFAGKLRGVYPNGIGLEPIANYPSDLNAMREAEKVIPVGLHNLWVNHILRIMAEAGVMAVNWKETAIAMLHATAAQRAEAFLRTLNLWDETK